MSVKLLANHNRIKPLSLNELFNKSFMVRYTDYSTLNDFFEAGNFIINSSKDIHPIRKKLNSYVNSTTQFSSWQNMVYKAGEEFMLKILDI